MQLGVEALATLAIALTASFQIGAGDAHPAGTFFALPERRLVSLGAIAFLSVFAEASVNDWSALYLSAGVGMTPGAAAGGFSGYALMMFLGRAFGDGVVHRLGRTRVVALGALAVFAGIGLAVATPSSLCLSQPAMSRQAPSVRCPMNSERCRPGSMRTTTLVARHKALTAVACGKATISSSAAARTKIGAMIFDRRT